MNKTPRHFFGLALTAIATVTSQCTLAWPQDQKAEYDLTWKLGHAQAAVYEVFDGVKGIQTQNFCLLGCEVEKRVGATQGSDLPFRYLFKSPRSKVHVGSRWEITETAFGDLPVVAPNVGPVLITGAYFFRAIKKLHLSDVLKATGRGKKDKGEVIEIAIVEGQFQLCRGNWTGNKVTPAEQKPSATISTIAYCRLTDGVIVGGQVQMTGRVEDYRGSWSGPAVSKGATNQEVLLKEPFVEVTKKGLIEGINRAVEKGEKWLVQQRAKDGVITDRTGYAVGTSHSGGSTALAVLALLHSGADDRDQGIQQAFSYLATQRFIMTYDLASMLMAVEGKYLPLSWADETESYSEEKARSRIAGKITKQDKDLVSTWTARLIENQGESGMFGYSRAGDGDNLSTTQYAVLGLKSASRMGVVIPPIVWKKALTYLQTALVSSGGAQNVQVVYRAGTAAEQSAPTTGWGYLHPTYTAPTGTMVAAGLTILAISRSELERAKEWDNKSEQYGREVEWGALAWLQKNYSIRSGTPEGCCYMAAMPYYYLYSLERAFVVSDIVLLNGHDWYHEGAAILLSWQRDDGHWEGVHGTPVIDTAFALLFLKRATIPVETGGRKSVVPGDTASEDKRKDSDPKDR